MKKVFLFSIGLIFSHTMFSQTVKATGMIIYEETIGSKVNYLEMFFTSDAYMYYDKNNVANLLPEVTTFKSVEDSLEYVSKREKAAKLFAIQPPARQIWYGKSGNNVVINSFALDDNPIYVADTLNFVSWELVEDTQTINGIVCQKAKGTTPKGSKLTAWFAPGIPVTVAPYTLRGLPGLLIEVKYDNNQMQMKTLKLEWPLAVAKNIELPDKSKVVSKAESNRLVQKHNEDAMKLLEHYKKNSQ